jgi:pimeloyl-[acyl-carrier protein] synthase
MSDRPTVSGFDGPSTPDFSRDPYPFYSHLRESEPLVYDDFLDGWLLSRHSDVSDSLTDDRLSADRLPSDQASVSAHGTFLGLRQAMLMFSEPPRHSRVRRAVSTAMRFDPTKTRSMVTDCARHLLDSCKDQPEVDLIAELAMPLPVLVLVNQLGIPVRDAERVSDWADIFNRALGRSVADPLIADAEKAASEFGEYVERLVDDGGVADGILGRLNSAVKEGTLGREEMVASAFMLVSAGRGTVTDFIANGLYALIRDPLTEASLRRDPTTIPSALDELLRLESPVQLTRREAKLPISFHGRTIDTGDRVIPLLGAANCDPAIFSEPRRFLSRGGRSRLHLAFGAGRHRCPGAGLAKIEASVAIGLALECFGPLHLCQEPAWKQNPTFRGIERLVVASRPNR